MSKHRVDEIDDLMGRVREHYDRLDGGDETTDRFAADLGRPRGGLGQSAHRPSGLGGFGVRPPVDVNRAYRENLKGAASAEARAFGRRGPVRHRVFERESPSRLASRANHGEVRSQPNRVPSWIRSRVNYEDAVVLIETRAYPAFVAARGSLKGKSLPPSDSPPAEPQFREPAEAERTSVDFAYVPGQSAFERLAEGAEVSSGRGADFFDPDATQVMLFGRPDPET